MGFLSPDLDHFISILGLLGQSLVHFSQYSAIRSNLKLYGLALGHFDGSGLVFCPLSAYGRTWNWAILSIVYLLGGHFGPSKPGIGPFFLYFGPSRPGSGPF